MHMLLVYLQLQQCCMHCVHVNIAVWRVRALAIIAVLYLVCTYNYVGVYSMYIQLYIGLWCAYTHNYYLDV